MNVLVVNSSTLVRASVIGARTQSEIFGVATAMMIDQLKDRMRSGVAHFVYAKKDGTIREAWGTLNRALVATKVNGRGESREAYYTSAYFDVEVGAFRSFKWENLVAIL